MCIHSVLPPWGMLSCLFLMGQKLSLSCYTPVKEKTSRHKICRISCEPQKKHMFSLLEKVLLLGVIFLLFLSFIGQTLWPRQSIYDNKLTAGCLSTWKKNNTGTCRKNNQVQMELKQKYWWQMFFLACWRSTHQTASSSCCVTSPSLEKWDVTWWLLQLCNAARGGEVLQHLCL